MSRPIYGGQLEELGNTIISYAERNGIGFWAVIFGLSVVVLAWRSPELLKSVGEFVNERRRILDETRLKQDQASRRIEAARKRRTKEGQKK